MPTPFRQLQKLRPGLGPILMYFLPLPLFLVVANSLLAGNVTNLLSSLFCLFTFWSSAWMLRKAHRYQWEANRRKWARSTRFPWKAASAVLTGFGVFVLLYQILDNSLILALIGAGMGSLGLILRYGVDPQFNNNSDVTLVGVTTEELVEILGEAEENLLKIELSARKINDLDIRSRLNRITKDTQKILSIIENDPKDLRKARKFLKVYLHGTRMISEKYANSPHSKVQNELGENFRNVLGTIESSIDELKEKLIENDVLDLDVKIEVLEAQLKNEGVI